ncbi:hypothetical protein JOD45_000723 [Scopulibacillus daqui]|uniref:Uncharacterized protein n=1 Tax=Scopulibacillus daqui TaxID=1469162 RepID=A0ABS2PXU6_9BACL|nr:hypothetical protein [Scopulibacillus daqui]
MLLYKRTSIIAVVVEILNCESGGQYVGALVYYLKAVSWQVPDFHIKKYLPKLYRIHQLIQSNGYFDVKQHRFIVKAKAI